METLRITLLISSLILVIIALVVIAGVEFTGTDDDVDESYTQTTGTATTTLIGYSAGYETTTGNESGPWGSGSFPYNLTGDITGDYYITGPYGRDRTIPKTTGDSNVCISQWDHQDVLDYLESISGTPTWEHSMAFGSDDILLVMPGQFR